MQAEKGFENLSMLKTIRKIVKMDGFRGLYSGCVPPLWGSGVYRSIQFSAFEAV
jgi:solute carrier family 25 (mitochondrial carnitine/acylcarnitine transporter), member 20/29